MANIHKKRRKDNRDHAFEELLNNAKFNASYWEVKSGGPSYGLETDAIVALRRMGYRGSLGEMLREFYSNISGETFFISAYVKAVFKATDHVKVFKGVNFRVSHDGETYTTFRLDGLPEKKAVIPKVISIEVVVKDNYADELKLLVYNHDSKALEAVQGVLDESKGIYRFNLMEALQSVLGAKGDIRIKFNEPLQSADVTLHVKLIS